MTPIFTASWAMALPARPSVRSVAPAATERRVILIIRVPPEYAVISAVQKIGTARRRLANFHVLPRHTGEDTGGGRHRGCCSPPPCLPRMTGEVKSYSFLSPIRPTSGFGIGGETRRRVLVSLWLNAGSLPRTA